MRRLRFEVAYDGTEFHGWQVQPGLPTIQSILEQIISDMEGKRVHVAGSGRTDAGVTPWRKWPRCRSKTQSPL